MIHKLVKYMIFGAGIAGAAAVLAACTSSSISGTGSHGSPHIDVSRVKSYTSVAQLAADSTLVANVQVTSQQSATAGTLPFITSTAQVQHVIIGTAAPTSSIVINQVGNANTTSTAPLTQVGTSYLVFLTRTKAPSLNGYYVVGVGAGLYLDTGKQYEKLDSQSPQLPGVIGHQQLAGMIGGQ